MLFQEIGGFDILENKKGGTRMKYNIDFNNITDSHWWDSNLTTAIIALIGVIASVVITYYTNKKAAERDKKVQKELQDRLLETQGNNEKAAIEARQEFEEKLAKSQQAFEERMTKIQIDANLRSSARIKWIQKVREEASQFISLAIMIQGMINNVLKDNSKSTDFNFEYNMIRDKIELFNKSKMLLMLYFGNNKENDLIVTKINSVYSVIATNATRYSSSDIDQKIKESETSEKSATETIDDLSDSLRLYLKKEWDKAKNGD